MAKYFLDTGILVGFIRGSDYAKYVEEAYRLSEPQNFIFISVVTVGEIYSLAVQFGWGESKIRDLESILKEIPVVDINSDEIIRRYAEIDVFSQGRHPNKRMPSDFSARNMGKNDLWIASTASVLNAKLLTIDRDFDHLDKTFVEVIYIDKEKQYSF